jgi:hypothetical protein
MIQIPDLLISFAFSVPDAFTCACAAAHASISASPASNRDMDVVFISSPSP